MLSKVHPVGVMIYQNIDFMNLVWYRFWECLVQ